MFVRKKSKSGVISVQVIDKSHSKYEVLKTIGSSSDVLEIEQLYQAGNNWIKSHTGLFEFDFTNERQQTSQFLENIQFYTPSKPLSAYNLSLVYYFSKNSSLSFLNCLL